MLFVTMSASLWFAAHLPNRCSQELSPAMLLRHEGGGRVEPCLNLVYKTMGYFEFLQFLTIRHAHGGMDIDEF